MTAKLKIGSGLHRARKNRSRGPRPAAKVIPDFRTMRFEHKGQDFLWWTITEHGDVVGCGPFQGSTWTKCVVLNHATLAVGDQPVFKSPHIAEPKTLRYRVVAIWEGFDHMEPKGVSPEKFLKAPRHVVAAPQPLRLRPVPGAQTLPPLPQPIIARARGRRT